MARPVAAIRRLSTAFLCSALYPSDPVLGRRSSRRWRPAPQCASLAGAAKWGADGSYAAGPLSRGLIFDRLGAGTAGGRPGACGGRRGSEVDQLATRHLCLRPHRSQMLLHLAGLERLAENAAAFLDSSVQRGNVSRELLIDGQSYPNWAMPQDSLLPIQFCCSFHPATSWPPKTIRRMNSCVSDALNPNTGALASSRRFITSALNRMSVAAMLLSSCDTLLAPINVDETPARARVQASATCAAGRSSSAATIFSAVRISQFRSTNLLLPNGFAPLSRPVSAVFPR